MKNVVEEVPMPIYEYVCNSCGEEFEQLVFSSDKVIKCRKCGSEDTVKKMSMFAMKSSGNFRGTGKKASSGCKGCTSTNCSSCGG